MNRFILSGTAVAAAMAISACGGGGGGSGTSSAASSGGRTGTVSVDQLSGVGRVLVDRRDKALYTSNVEASGGIVCTGGCTAFWKPVTVAAGKPTASPGAGKLGAIKRPDGASQLTANG